MVEFLKKSALSLRLLILTLVMSGSLPSYSNGAKALLPQDHLIVAFDFRGLSRSRLSWLETYLNLSLPRKMNHEDFSFLRKKLLTTNIFSQVSVHLDPLPSVPTKNTGPNEATFSLRIEVEEKWTTIPVVRGAYGGGTPLSVIGGYDTHAFGQLWTVGAEARKYGNAPPGGVIYGNAPRWGDGSRTLGFEGWREFRERMIYPSNFYRNSEGLLVSVTSSTQKGRAYYFWPLFDEAAYRPDAEVRHPSNSWRLGVDFVWAVDQPESIKLQSVRGDRLQEEEKAMGLGEAFSWNPQLRNVRLIQRPVLRTSLLPTLIYDDIFQHNIQMKGLRFIVRSGPQYNELSRDDFSSSDRVEGQSDTNRWALRFESELFYYARPFRRMTLAWHQFVGVQSSEYLQSQYFLGGFDSIRGYPDGISYGNKAIYGNIEWRHAGARTKYLWTENVAFFDWGKAAHSAEKLLSDMRSSTGFGVRFAIPQVYRLVLRVDYAFALDGSGWEGLSIGLNQFFQPYKPLWD